MTRPDPMDDIQLDRLLGTHQVPPLSGDFAQRVAAEAVRADRAPSLAPFPSPAHRVRRPWARRGLVAGVVAVNLIVASAIAATFSGHFPALQHVATTVVRALHIPHHHAAPHPIRVAHAAPPHREVAIVAPPPLSPEALTPRQIFAERHPLLAMRREGLLPSGPLAQRRATLFAERHPFAVRAMARRAQMRALRNADATQIPPLREERPTAIDRGVEAADASGNEMRGGLRARFNDREAFERERQELEQRANAEWPARPGETQAKAADAHDLKPAAAAERKPAHPNWRERMRVRRQARLARRRHL